MKTFQKILVFILVVFSAQLIAQDFQTLTYFKNYSTELQLDLFMPSKKSAEKTPLVIYVHGGGFSGGNRTGGHALGKFLANHNITTATITYTLYMKDKNFSCNGILAEKVKAFQIAANQLWHATAFLMEKAEKLNFDTSKIFIAGSSAGAETVLHAAFWDRKQMALYGEPLAPAFQYAGLISGAGAIMDLNLITEKNLIPAMLFHGDADPTVPYATAAHHYCPPNSPGWLMFFGSHSVAKHIESLDGTCQLTTFLGGTHKFAGAFFYQNQQPVLDFIERVLAGEKFIEYREMDGTN